MSEKGPLNIAVDATWSCPDLVDIHALPRPSNGTLPAPEPGIEGSGIDDPARLRIAVVAKRGRARHRGDARAVTLEMSMRFLASVSAIAGFALISALSAAGCGDEASSGSSASTGTGGGGTGGAGGDGGAGGAGGAGGGMASEYEKLCQAEDDRNVMCNGDSPDPAEVEKCIKNAPCYEAAFREGVTKEIYTCLAERPCGVGEDSCFGNAADAQPDTTKSTTFAAACLNKDAGCQMAGKQFINDFCFIAKLFKDSVLDDMGACLKESCDAATACLVGVYDKLFEGCPGK
jgi:hypothetical protein